MQYGFRHYLTTFGLDKFSKVSKYPVKQGTRGKGSSDISDSSGSSGSVAGGLEYGSVDPWIRRSCMDR